MNGTSWAISLLLVVASWTVSHDIPMVLSAEEADEASWLLMVSRCDASGGSAQRMPVVECSKWSRGSGTAKVRHPVITSCWHSRCQWDGRGQHQQPSVVHQGQDMHYAESVV